MFNFGLFSSHIPYIFIAIVCISCYLPSLVGDNSKLMSKLNAVATSFGYEITISHQPIEKECIDIALEKEQEAAASPDKKSSKYFFLIKTIKKKIPLASCFDAPFYSNIFSRSPPVFYS